MEMHNSFEPRPSTFEADAFCKAYAEQCNLLHSDVTECCRCRRCRYHKPRQQPQHSQTLGPRSRGIQARCVLLPHWHGCVTRQARHAQLPHSYLLTHYAKAGFEVPCSSTSLIVSRAHVRCLVRPHLTRNSGLSSSAVGQN